jgi:hypothetical protein
MTPTEVRSPQRLTVRFLGEQDGIPEQELKAKLVTLFKQNELVSRAYLARVSLSPSEEVVVALCLPDNTESQAEIVRGAGAEFAELFSVNQHLDVVFVSAEDERRLASVCKPFFRREAVRT